MFRTVAMTSRSKHFGTSDKPTIGASAGRTRRQLSIGLIGPGQVGSSLLDRIFGRREFVLRNLGVNVTVSAVANSKFMVLDEPEEEPTDWRIRLRDSSVRFATDFDSLTDHIQRIPDSEPVIVDCTNSDEVALKYREWLERGIHIVTPNKRAVSGDLDYYLELQRLSRHSGVRFLYETTVGAALPILRTLRDLTTAGDQILKIEGILSGSMSYILGNYDGSMRFSDLVAKAQSLGYMEPDPREDLAGIDIARKTVILAREIGTTTGMDEVSIEGLVSNQDPVGVHSLATALEDLDNQMRVIVRSAVDRGQVPRLIGEVIPGTGCRVSLRNFDLDHPFAGVRPNDNIVRIVPSSHEANPIVIQGSGSGPQLTAGGLFAELTALGS